MNVVRARGDRMLRSLLPMRRVSAAALIVFVLACGLAVCACSPRKTMELGSEPLTNAGIQAYYEGDMERSERYLRGAIAHSRDDSLARFYLAKAYLARGTPGGGMAAEETLSDLVAVASSEPVYLERLARLRLRQGYRSNARRILDRLLELRPENAGALYQLGRLAEGDWWRFVHAPLRGQAVDFYTRALAIDSVHVPSLVRLAVLAIEADSLDVAAPVVERLMLTSPTDERARLLLGVIREQHGDFRAAEDVFAAVVDEMPTYRRRAYSSPTFLEPDTLVGIWDLDADEEEEVLPAEDATFWVRHDPSPATPANERFAVHASRMAMADFLYGDSRKGVYGWETAPGEFYVRFGRPIRREFRIMTWLHTFSIGGNPVDIRFIDYAQNGTFMLPIGYKEMGKDMLLVQTGPESTPLAENGVEPPPLRHIVTWFRAAGGEPRLEVAIAAPSAYWSSETSVSDSAWQEVYHGAEILEPWPIPSGIDGEDDAVLLTQLFPGRDAAHLRLAVGGRAGSVEADLPAPLAPDGFALSDIVPGFDMPGGFIPNPGFRYPPGETLGIRFELYGIRRDATGIGYARVRLAIIPEESRDSGIAGVADALFGDSERVPAHITSELQEEIPSDTWSRTLRIDLSELEPGRYRIELDVQDLLTGTEVSREASFEIG